MSYSVELHPTAQAQCFYVADVSNLQSQLGTLVSSALAEAQRWRSAWLQAPSHHSTCLPRVPFFQQFFPNTWSWLRKLELRISTDTSSFHHHSIYPETVGNVLDPLSSSQDRPADRCAAPPSTRLLWVTHRHLNYLPSWAVDWRTTISFLKVSSWLLLLSSAGTRHIGKMPLWFEGDGFHWMCGFGAFVHQGHWAVLTFSWTKRTLCIFLLNQLIQSYFLPFSIQDVFALSNTCSCSIMSSTSQNRK